VIVWLCETTGLTDEKHGVSCTDTGLNTSNGQTPNDTCTDASDTGVGSGEGSEALARTELVITDGELLMEPSESEVESESREKLKALKHAHVTSETGHPDSSQNERSSTMEAGVAVSELTDFPVSVPLLQQLSNGDAISNTHRSSKSGSTATHDALLSNTSDPIKPPADFNPNVVPGEIKELVLMQFVKHHWPFVHSASIEKLVSRGGLNRSWKNNGFHCDVIFSSCVHMCTNPLATKCNYYARMLN